MEKPSSESKLGIDDGSCFLCGWTVVAPFSTAASAIFGGVLWAVARDWERCSNEGAGPGLRRGGRDAVDVVGAVREVGAVKANVRDEL